MSIAHVILTKMLFKIATVYWNTSYKDHSTVNHSGLWYLVVEGPMIAPHRSPSPGTPSSLSSSSDSDTSGGTYLSKTKHCSVQSYKICIKTKENTLNLATFQQWYQLGWHTPPGFLSYPARPPLLTSAPECKIICWFSTNQPH